MHLMSKNGNESPCDRHHPDTEVRLLSIAATQSISMSKCPGHAGTLMKILAGGFGPKKRA
jgi:hypothetical protein